LHSVRSFSDWCSGVVVNILSSGLIFLAMSFSNRSNIFSSYNLI
jgi:hypothetical protein